MSRPTAQLKARPPRVFAQAPDRRHRAEVPSPDDEARAGPFVRLDESGDLGRIVLAVGVERHDGIDAVGEGPAEPRPQGLALALVGSLADDGRAGGLGSGRRVIAAAIVDDQDG